MQICRQLRIAHDYAQVFEAWGFKCCMVEDEPDKVLLVVRYQQRGMMKNV